MFEIRVLSKEDISSVIEMQQVIDVVEAVYKARSEGMTEIWPTVFYDFISGKADMDIKSGYLKKEKLFGHKTVTWFEDNAKKGLPTLMGMISVFDAETGQPIGIMDASYITGIRTGAAGALGAKYLAKKNSENLLILGVGNQALFQIAATLKAFPNLRKVQVAAMHIEKAKSFIDNINEKLESKFGINTESVTFKAVENLESAVKDSQIIITVTPSRKPIIKKEWVQKGTHISCIGADMEGKQEIDSKLMSSSLIFVDDKEHCKQVGEIEIPLKKGMISDKDIAGEIGDLILGKVEGRTSEDQITIFDATGMALLDIAIAKIVLQLAEKKGLGTKVNF
ncbi:ornithine cyclodeaminase family protein [Clostridium oceanicum]|uniref:Alanine dehydrogenase n=1 Tax=Clostridium oceanicum TaxID=1543 RepID=A0ABP3UFJ1_9CLOT